MSSEDLISQFMVFTGCLDGERAQQYLEMSNMNVETAVGLYMEHVQHGSTSSDVALASPEIRAPDRTRTMRLMDDVGLGGSAGNDIDLGGLLGYTNSMDDHDIVMSAFSHVDARAAVNAAAAANDDNDAEEKGRDQPATRSDELSANLSDIFAPPTHLVHRGGGFQGARAVARDARRWLLVNIQRDSEFACHALNRDVWRDELVENLVREGFIFWQAVSHFKVLLTCHTCEIKLLTKTSNKRITIPPRGRHTWNATRCMIILTSLLLTLERDGLFGKRRDGRKKNHSLQSTLQKWPWTSVQGTRSTKRHYLRLRKTQQEQMETGNASDRS